MTVLMALAAAASGAVFNCSSTDQGIKSPFLIRLVPNAINPKRAFVAGQPFSFDVDRSPVAKWKARTEAGQIFVSRTWASSDGAFKNATIKFGLGHDTSQQLQFSWNAASGALGGHIVLVDEGNGVCSLVPNTNSFPGTFQ